MSRDLLQYVQACEESAHQALIGSSRRGALDAGKATAILGTYVVSVIDGQIANYSRLYSYDSRWTGELTGAALHAAYGMLHDISGDSYCQIVLANLERIIEDHLKTKAQEAKAQQKQQASARPIASRPIGEQIDELRKESRLTVEDLAEALDVELRSIYRHLSDKAQPRARHIAAYEKLFSQKLNKTIRLEMSATKPKVIKKSSRRH